MELENFRARWIIRHITVEKKFPGRVVSKSSLFRIEFRPDPHGNFWRFDIRDLDTDTITSVKYRSTINYVTEFRNVAFSRASSHDESRLPRNDFSTFASLDDTRLRNLGISTKCFRARCSQFLLDGRKISQASLIACHVNKTNNIRGTRRTVHERDETNVAMHRIDQISWNRGNLVQHRHV